MTKTKVIMLACFCAAFGAGVAVGVAGTRLAAEPGRRSWLGHELNLTPQQREQMRQIWSGVMSASWQKQHEERQALDRERDEAIRGLLTEEQKARYDEVMRKHAEKSAALEEARRKPFEEAVERTRQILTESQRKKYEELLQERGGRHPGGSPPGRPATGKETQPPRRP